jgi:hypothetical protein
MKVALVLALITALVLASGCIYKETTLPGPEGTPAPVVRDAKTPPAVVPAVTPREGLTSEKKRTGVPCGWNTCPAGWQCCKETCYDPQDDPRMVCQDDTLMKKRLTCSEITCTGAASACCEDATLGAVCYDPQKQICTYRSSTG